MNLKESKTWLRKYLMLQRQQLSRAQRKRKSDQIAAQVIRSTVFKKAHVVAAFVSFGTEVQTRKILEAAWRLKKKVLIPVSAHGFDKPYFVEYQKSDELQKMPHGPFELIEERSAFPMEKIDLMLIPGLGFDHLGYRIGYGGGVYDRIIKKTPQANHVGLFFAEQELHALPHAAYDLQLSEVYSH